ncbi:MAG: hypothetical protein LBG87_00025 [Spirochaetaceae bacterium]|nr:hypothetical protein [Spirochaetaceae bacterium]
MKNQLIAAGIFSVVLSSCSTKGALAPTAVSEKLSGGEVQVFDLGGFKLHAFITADPMGDISNIIEGKNEAVILEYAAFTADISAEDGYIQKLGKPVAKVIADYHLAGLEKISPAQLVLIEGMPEFEKGPVYSGMIANFAAAFFGAMDTSPHGPAEIAALPSAKNFAGIDFQFSPGPANDFPAASIIIGGKVRYTHWTPAKAHFSPLQIGDRAAVDAVLEDLKKAKASGCVLFTGGHGGGVARIDAVDFQIAYLGKVKELLQTCADADGFTAALHQAYPDLAGDDNLSGLAQNLYK